MPETSTNTSSVQANQSMQLYFKYSPAYAGSMESVAWLEFDSIFEGLPLTLQDILVSKKTIVFFDELVKSKIINSNQGTTLAAIVRGIITGTLFIGDLTKIIANELHIPEGTALNISNTLINSLFKNALEDIKQIQSKTAARRGDKELVTSVTKPVPVHQESASTQPVFAPAPQPPKQIQTFANIVDLRQKP